MSKKTTYLFFFLLLTVFMISCAGSNTQITGSWANKEKIKNEKIKSVFIAVLTSNMSAKTVLENELAFQASQRDVESFKSHNVFTRTFTKDNMPSRDELLKAIRATNAQTIFTVALKDRETSTRYVPGSTSYYPMGMGMGYYGNFYGYYSNVYPMMYDPGYYTTDKTYYLESNLYDTASEELIWSAQSATYNPTDLENFVKGYTETLLKQLEKDGIIKKAEL
ncbi:hypothetical protein GN157_07440 [Flavobacterium rakeshii]|uniref:DUF4136 domain-containing protein n=1 Tax=Flavobacterium rakeshii TaxID=1038845 RepID=A0A6N8HCD2_9FLAO|nr:hypothetical protein [Flavobacterium rakeshii]MUV03540.1 hypothetical protein [Flavobacterium rakeshii]